MPDYSLGKIYKIICHKTGLVYIGSTCEPTLARRLAGHVGDYKRYLKGGKKYTTSFKIIENASYEIVLIETYVCESKDELHKMERFFIENNNCVNKYIPIRTEVETKNIMKMYSEAYNLKNIVKINERQKRYDETHKEKRKEYLRNKNKTIDELI